MFKKILVLAFVLLLGAGNVSAFDDGRLCRDGRTVVTGNERCPGETPVSTGSVNSSNDGFFCEDGSVGTTFTPCSETPSAAASTNELSTAYEDTCGEQDTNAEKRQCCQESNFNTHACYVQLGVVQGLSGAREGSDLVVEQPEVEGQASYEQAFMRECPASNFPGSNNTTNYGSMRNCLTRHCGTESNQSECSQAAAHYLQRQGVAATEAYQEAVNDHYDAVVAYENCVAANPANPADACAEQAAAVENANEALDSDEARVYSATSGAASNMEAQSERARAMEALQSQTAFFDLNNISVGNEKNLEIGGSDNNESNVLARVINLMARLFGTVAVLMFVIGAFFMIVSQGDENQLQKGKTIVLYTILGLLVGFTAYIAVQFVINILFQT